MLDNTLEFLVMSGMDLPLAVMITDSGAMDEQPYNVPEENRIFISIMRP